LRTTHRTGTYVKCSVIIEITMWNAIIIIKTHVRKILSRPQPSPPQPPALANVEIEIYRRPLTPHPIHIRLSIILLSYCRHNIKLFDKHVKHNNMAQVLTVCSCATPSPCRRLRSDKSCRTWHTRNCRPGSRSDPFLWGSNRQRQAVHPRVTSWPTPVGIYHL